MQERTVLLLVVALVLSTAAAGVAVNVLRPNDAGAWRAFNLAVSANGSAAVGSPINVAMSLRQGMLDPKSLWVVFLSLDAGTMNITSATPASNPWGYPTVWNLTGLDLSGTRFFNATLVPTEAGSTILYAMVWVPLGDVRSVPIGPSGHVNPSGVALESIATVSVLVTAG